MNPQLLEFALRKQRLQIRSSQLRGEFAAAAVAFEPLFHAGDKLRAGVQWLRRHPEAAAAAGVAVLVARPRGLVKWARRGVLAWQGLRGARAWLDHRLSR